MTLLFCGWLSQWLFGDSHFFHSMGPQLSRIFISGHREGGSIQSKPLGYLLWVRGIYYFHFRSIGRNWLRGKEEGFRNCGPWLDIHFPSYLLHVYEPTIDRASTVVFITGCILVISGRFKESRWLNPPYQRFSFSWPGVWLQHWNFF